MNKEIKEKVKKLKDEYEVWKTEQLEKGGYFTIFNDFKNMDYLTNLSSGAIKLYIFLGIVSKNKTGESYYSINKIAKYFKKSDQTIITWIKELEKNDLIERLQFTTNGVSHTFLKPYKGKEEEK